MSTQSTNLQELVGALSRLTDEKGEPRFSPEMMTLMTEGLHHAFLPDSLKPKAAEAFQLAYEGIGGLSRLIQWADRYPASFYKLFARQTIPTITPVLPPPLVTQADNWPPWITAQRLAYQHTATGGAGTLPDEESDLPP